MPERYHEVIRPLREIASSALNIGARALDRLPIGRSEPTPRHIVDLGKTVSQARSVQLVIESFPTIERTDISQLSNTAQNRWDSMGDYTERSDG
jgi:hypothetical protein